MHAETTRTSILGNIAPALALVCGCVTTQRAETGTQERETSTYGAIIWQFDKCDVGRVPEGWIIRETNPTETLAGWEIVEDDTAPSPSNVLALTRTTNYNGTYNLAIAEKSSFADLDLTVRVKAIKGKEDQGGGPIWRCKNQNNYYICRFNPLEGNYRVYVVKDGKRRQLDSIKVDTRPGKWYAVRAVMIGERITCYLDDRKMLEVTDATFAEGGMVGLWTKADAVTSFDDLHVKSLDQD